MSGLSVVNVRVVCYGCPGYVLRMSGLCVVNVLVVMKWISVGWLWISGYPFEGNETGLRPEPKTTMVAMLEGNETGLRPEPRTMVVAMLEGNETGLRPEPRTMVVFRLLHWQGEIGRI